MPLLCRSKGELLSTNRELPPKSLHTQTLLEVKRDELMRDIHRHCIQYQDVHDMGRARDLLRSYTCAIFDLLKESYKQKITVWHWEREIAQEAIQIALKCWDELEVRPDALFWKETLERAIDLHTRRNLFEPLRINPPTPQVAPITVPRLLPEVPTPSPFADELRRLLTEARWTAEIIAEKIGISPRNVYRHLSSETKPSLTNVAAYETVTRHSFCFSSVQEVRVKVH